MTFGIHLCRGNQRSMWHREGAYDAIAERLFNELPHERFLLEYDTPRAGSFEPLRFVPKGRVVVLGLVSTKDAGAGNGRRAEAPDRRRPANSCRSTSSPSRRNAASPPTWSAICSAPDDQKRKLERVVETARAGVGVAIRNQKSGIRSQGSEVRDQKSGIRSQGSEVRDQKSGIRSQGSEVRDQKSGIRSQGSESEDRRSLIPDTAF